MRRPQVGWDGAIASEAPGVSPARSFAIRALIVGFNLPMTIIFASLTLVSRGKGCSSCGRTPVGKAIAIYSNKRERILLIRLTCSGSADQFDGGFVPRVSFPSGVERAAVLFLQRSTRQRAAFGFHRLPRY